MSIFLFGFSRQLMFDKNFCFCQLKRSCVCRANVLTSFVLLSLERHASCLPGANFLTNCRQIFTEQLSCGENTQSLPSCNCPFAWLSHEASVDARPQVSQPLSARLCLFFSFNYFVAFLPLSLLLPDTCRQSNGR